MPNSSIISPKYVAQSDYTGIFMSCRGVFDCKGICHEVPLAEVRICAQDIGCPDEIQITVGVWDLASVRTTTPDVLSDRLSPGHATKELTKKGEGEGLHCEPACTAKITSCEAQLSTEKAREQQHKCGVALV